MDSDVLAAKLETLRHCVQRVRAKTPPSATILRSDDERLGDFVDFGLAIEAVLKGGR